MKKTNLLKSLTSLFGMSILLTTGLEAQPWSQAMPIPDTLRFVAGDTINLNVDSYNTIQFMAGVITPTNGVNGPILAPTILIKNGDEFAIKVHNNLSEMTTMHWHGFHLPVAMDGGPHQMIMPGVTWTAYWTIDQFASTMWYHPHLHETTAEQVSRGVAGMFIITDDVSDALNLPETYGVDDIPLIIQAKEVDPVTGEIAWTGNAQDENVHLVNGRRDPYYEVPPQMVRFRLLDGSIKRNYLLKVFDDADMANSNSLPMYHIASDGGLLEAPVAIDSIFISVGERNEIVVDFSNYAGQTLSLWNVAGPLTNGNLEILEIRVGSVATANAVTSLPTVLTTIVYHDESEVDVTRKITMAQVPGGPFTLDGAPYNSDVINHNIKLGDLEIWELENTTNIGHPFHIHDIQFQILDITDVNNVVREPIEGQKGWKDVVFVEGEETVRFITRFDDFADSVTTFMYHCHILTHEDGGMMGQFLVLDTASVTTGTDNLNFVGDIGTYPNPTDGKFKLSVSFQEEGPVQVEVFNVLSELVYSSEANNTTVDSQIDLSDQPNGVYLLKVSVGEEVTTSTIIKQ